VAYKKAHYLKEVGYMGDAIKYLYSQFILRDVLSFITPGAIVTIAALLLFFPAHVILCVSHSIHWALYIPIFGVFYMVGFALQCFGDLIGFIRFTPYGEKERSCGKRWRMFCCDFTRDYDKRKKPNKSNIWWWKEDEKLHEFYEAAADNTGVQQGHERMVVMKQMCANGFLALLIAGIFIPVYLFCTYTWVNIILGALLAIVLLGSLLWGYHVHMLRQYTRETVFIEERKGGGGAAK
jgi:hypothetical protein